MSALGVKIIKNNEVKKLIYSRRKKLKKVKEIKSEDDIDKLIKVSPFKKIFSFIFSLITIVVFLLCAGLCAVNVYAKVNNRPTTMFGYSFMVIASESMVASGFNVGDVVSVRAVNTKTLKRGDVIAFYVNRNSYSSFRTYESELVWHDNKINVEYLDSFENFFGQTNADMDKASKTNCKLVFHQIVEIYEDEAGVRWFETKGTSNPGNDTWYIKETLVVGIYDNSDISLFLSGFLQKLSTIEGIILCVVMPLMFILLVQLLDFVKYFALAVIENQLVVGIRKPTDAICVKYMVGMHLSNKDKFRVLARAPEGEEILWCNLLWWQEDKKASFKKFIHKKRVLTMYHKQMQALTDKCEELYKDGEKFETINRYYAKEKEEIDKKHELRKKRLKLVLASKKAEKKVAEPVAEPVTGKVKLKKQKQKEQLAVASEPAKQPIKEQFVEPAVAGGYQVKDVGKEKFAEEFNKRQEEKAKQGAIIAPLPKKPSGLQVVSVTKTDGSAIKDKRFPVKKTLGTLDAGGIETVKVNDVVMVKAKEEKATPKTEDKTVEQKKPAEPAKATEPAKDAKETKETKETKEVKKAEKDKAVKESKKDTKPVAEKKKTGKEK